MPELFGEASLLITGGDLPSTLSTSSIKILNLRRLGHYRHSHHQHDVLPPA